ncbi:hypothetical protein GCM10008967_22760 [Bacillus carboniphilus]|uniref:Uncharacterized protein n=1 Tax=Bacillus carboniphilus TaxID=86663 RepID=A0ABN0WBB4_9BACI
MGDLGDWGWEAVCAVFCVGFLRFLRGFERMWKKALDNCSFREFYGYIWKQTLNSFDFREFYGYLWKKSSQ